MSLLIPNSNDYHDAHGDLDQDRLYHSVIAERYSSNPDQRYWRFSAQQSFFKQSNPDTNDLEFRYTEQDFGIEKPWGSIVDALNELNASAPSNVQYKLIFFARHGQGWANVAGRKYSKEEWYSKWRFLGTDGEITWGPDADLTELGVKQAHENHNAWASQLQKGAPYPKSFYVSPLQRSIKTHNITWPNTKPLVVEHLRETVGLHLCHKRSPRSQLQSKFPNLVFSEDFEEEDKLFESYVNPRREQLHEQFARIHDVLQDIFDNDDNDIISITSHAGTIRAFITVIGHRKFTIPTGGMIPIVIKGVKE
ncbi:PMU2 [Candida theae]|uniref:PMU2 n=1 Tax=Candida theae TaxID=1198502 RepID=A0AAD5FXF9_9ASCO|nr:PMU2 [Candida theae]KAI5954853.1 PMU2 [Candida theae]